MTENLYYRLPSELKDVVDDYHRLIRDIPICKNKIPSMYYRDDITVEYEKPLDTIQRLLTILSRYKISDLEWMTSNLTSFLETFELSPELRAKCDKDDWCNTYWFDFHRKRMEIIEQEKIEEDKRLEEAKRYDKSMKETHLYSLVVELTKKVEEIQNKLLTTE